MTTPADAAHRLALGRIAAYRAGLLGPDEAQALREHLRACEPCRGVFADEAAPSHDEETNFGHLPDHVLVRWDRERGALPAPLVRAVEAHLSGCASCAASLGFVRATATGRAAGGRAGRAPWRAVGGAMAAAFAAVALVVVVARLDPGFRPAPDPVETPPAAVPAPAAPAAPPRGTPPESAPGSDPVQASPLPRRILSLDAIARGPDDAASIELSDGETAIVLAVPPLLGVGSDAQVTIEVLDASDVTRARGTLRQAELLAPGGGRIELRAAPGRDLRGRWRVRVTSDVPNPVLPGESEGAEYRFELR